MKKRTKLFILGFLICSLIISSCLVAIDLNAEKNLAITAVATTSENKNIQTKLKSLGYYQGAIDGVFGAATKQAVINFQKDNGLVADGIVGAQTASKLGLNLSSQTSSDVYLLAKTIHAEARGEPYVGQVAVGAVILNRVESPLFPNTISGVVYQPWAFTAVNDGQINLEPNSSSYQAARDALNGWDPTYGCLYYYNPVTATSQWIFTRKTVLEIGKHVFAL